MTDDQLTLSFDGLAGLNNRMNISGITFSEIGSRPLVSSGNQVAAGFVGQQFSRQDRTAATESDSRDRIDPNKTLISNQFFTEFPPVAIGLSGSLNYLIVCTDNCQISI